MLLRMLESRFLLQEMVLEKTCYHENPNQSILMIALKRGLSFCATRLTRYMTLEEVTWSPHD